MATLYFFPSMRILGAVYKQYPLIMDNNILNILYDRRTYRLTEKPYSEDHMRMRILEIELNCPRWIDRILRSQVNEGMKRDAVKLKYVIASISFEYICTQLLCI